MHSRYLHLISAATLLVLLPPLGWAGLVPSQYDFGASWYSDDSVSDPTWHYTDDSTQQIALPVWFSNHTQLSVHNRADPLRIKEVWFVVTYDSVSAVPSALPDISILDFPGFDVSPVGSPQVQGPTVCWQWTITPQPRVETFQFPDTSFWALTNMTQLDVYTRCIPAPRSVLLGCLGLGIIVSLVRQIRG